MGHLIRTSVVIEQLLGREGAELKNSLLSAGSESDSDDAQLWSAFIMDFIAVEIDKQQPPEYIQESMMNAIQYDAFDNDKDGYDENVEINIELDIDDDDLNDGDDDTMERFNDLHLHSPHSYQLQHDMHVMSEELDDEDNEDHNMQYGEYTSPELNSNYESTSSDLIDANAISLSSQNIS
jgi:hypothetical protein